MGFTQFLFMLGSLAVAGPIMAHLFNRTRYKRVPFTMVRFLELSHKQTQSRRRIKDMLILLLRCAIICLIAFLFTRPFYYSSIPAESTTDIHFLVIDDSLSMTCTQESDSCWDRMLDAARQYIKKNDRPRNVFYLYSATTGFLGSRHTAQSAQSELKQLKPGTGRTELLALATRLNQEYKSKGTADNINVFVISDFTPSFIDTMSKQTQSYTVNELGYQVIHPQDEADNMAITHGDFIKFVDNKLILSATITNHGYVSGRRLIKAAIGSLNSNEYFITLEPGQSETKTLTLDITDSLKDKTVLPVELSLTPNDDLLLDDKYSIAVNINKQREKKVLLLGDNYEQTFLMKTALETLSGSSHQNFLTVHTLNFDEFSAASLRAIDILFVSRIHPVLARHSNQLKQFLKAGGNTVFFTTGDLDSSAITELFDKGIIAAAPRRKVEKIVSPKPIEPYSFSDDNIFEPAALSILNQYKPQAIPMWSYYQSLAAPDALTLCNIDPQAYLIYAKPLEAGRTMLINSGIDDSTSALLKRPIILALCRLLLGPQQSISTFSFSTDEDIVLPVGSNFWDRMSKKETYIFYDEKNKKQAHTSGSHIVCPAPHPVGWARTISQPVYYAGICPIEKETLLIRSDTEHVEAILGSVFKTTESERKFVEASVVFKQKRELDKYIVILLLFLIILDMTIANRMQR